MLVFFKFCFKKCFLLPIIYSDGREVSDAKAFLHSGLKGSCHRSQLKKEYPSEKPHLNYDVKG